MLNTTRNHSTQAVGLRNALAAILLCGSGAAAAADIHLCALTGSTTLPPATASTTVPVLGYAIGTATACPASIAAPGGPVLSVAAGDNIILHNGLAETTGLLLPGIGLLPDQTGLAPGATTKTYTIPAAVSPGTYLYQAAPLANAEHQVAMGLHGALIVRAADLLQRNEPNVTTTNGSAVVLDANAQATDVGLKVSGAGIPAGATIQSVVAGTSFTMSAPATADGTVAVDFSKGSAYGGAATAYDDESILVLSEIDPALNGSADVTKFDMRNFAPKFFLINGKAYPATAPITSTAGHKLLLRYVNAGSKHHSMGALGLRQNFIAKDASLLPTAAVSVAAETLASGQTGDAMITVPASGKFAVYDASLHLHNGSAQGFGGMMTFVDAGAAPAASGPTTGDVAATPNPTNGTAAVALSAAITASGTSQVTAAEYFVDAKGTDGAGTGMSGTFGGATATVNASIDTAAMALLASGKHTIFVHGQDNSGTGNWGAYNFVVLNVDKTGPATASLTLSPNPSSGSVPVVLSASVSDAATGGSNVTAAEYFIDAAGANGAGTAMAMGGAAAPVRSASATIPALSLGALAAGPHTVFVHSQDALGNWGAVSPVTLTIVKGGPTTSNVLVTPNPNNGSYTLSSGQAVVRVTATFNGGASVVTSGEAFIDAGQPIADTLRGFVFVPTDGAWNSTTEAGYADIPIANIGALSNGTHTIAVRGKDSTGAWGTVATASLLIDRAAPALSSGTLSASTIAFGTPSVTLNFSATDAGGAGLAGVQYWFDSATAPTNPSVAAGTSSASLNTSTLAGGTHTVYFRARDAANNVSAAVLSANLTVVQARPDTYGLRNTNTSTGGNSRVQTVTVGTQTGVLANDLPNIAGRTAGPANPTVTHTPSTAAATMSVALNANGSFSYTINVPNSVTGNTAIRAAKRGTYQFTYGETLNGVTSNTTVTINVTGN